MIRSETHSDAGFSLLEALVALAILAISITGIIGVLGASFGNVERSAARLRAIIAARSLLDRVGLDIPNAVQSKEGVLPDGSRWTLSIRPYEDEPSIATEPGLYQVSVLVFPPPGKTSAVALTTLRPITEPR
ncbi:general secretion pathway protein I [Kaistia hirudinis]|uniref:General secretion pathway protein I n=1 Tax=Kaistia hirudinis TaxID=1293440 RepID=A0A840ANP8_9HYPH|nr:type II secretion system protein [Kaistia hirudinis]MBB3930036.1 general secretion pathway protein I [Kaistia hirudinis]